MYIKHDTRQTMVDTELRVPSLLGKTDLAEKQRKTNSSQNNVHVHSNTAVRKKGNKRGRR
eukprot:13600624-Heterocapsa_arctica.AAC.1